MTENRELRFLINLVFERIKRIRDVDVGNSIAFYADNVMMVILFHEFVTLHVIMEKDGDDDASLDENLKLSIECDFMDLGDIEFFEPTPNFVHGKRLHILREDLEKRFPKLRHAESFSSEIVAKLCGYGCFQFHTSSTITQLSCVCKTPNL